MTALPLAAEADGVAGRRRGWAIASVLAAMVVVVLDAAVATIALPTIAQSLQIAPGLAVRVVTAYQLGLVTMLFPAAALGESLGFRKIFVAGVALFTGAAVLCALAPSLPWLVAARLVQGVGGAGIMALGVALLRVSVPPHRLGAAIGWNAMTVALASAAGPTLGATVLSVAPWPWLFVLTLPVGVFVLIAARALPDVPGTGRALDRVSVALVIGTVALLAIGAEHAPSNLAAALASFVGGAACALVLIRREAGRAAPLIPLDLLRQPSLRVSVIASVLCFGGQAAGLVALPFHLQQGAGLTPLMTGLHLLPWPLTVALAGPLAGRLANRVPTAWLCLLGGTVLAVGLGAAAAVPAHTQPWAFGVGMMLCGLGFGLFNVPNNRAMFLSAPRERSGAAGGLQGAARLTGQTLGAVTMTLLFALVASSAAPRIGLVFGAALTLAAGLVSALRAPARHAP